jgi:hypothetical protein
MKPSIASALFVLVFFTACKPEKDEIIHILTLDAKTSAPLEGVNFSGSIVDQNSFQYETDFNLNTNADGKLDLVTPPGKGIYNLFIRKSGYYTQDGGFRTAIKNENSGETTIFMQPTDAKLRVIVDHNSVGTDSLLLGVFSSLYAADNGFSQGGNLISGFEDLFSLMSGQKDTSEFSVSLGELIDVKWSLNLSHRFYLNTKAPFSDTIRIQNNLTTYQLSY